MGYFFEITFRNQLDDPIDAVAVHGGGGRYFIHDINFYVYAVIQALLVGLTYSI